MVPLNLTTHPTQQAFVRRGKTDISMVIAIKANTQAKGCLQHYKLSTEENIYTICQIDGHSHLNSIYL